MECFLFFSILNSRGEINVLSRGAVQLQWLMA